MSEVTETAVEATIPTAPIFAQAKRKFDLPSAGEYLAAMHIGGDTFRNVAAAARDFAISKQTALQAAAGDVSQQVTHLVFCQYQFSAQSSRI
jgi:hypothetical protein